MAKSSAASVIRLRGVRHNNLKNFDLDLPLRQLIVITGLSGSGKSSLAFDTLFAEGQRRYIETFSPYARQFFDRMDKPQVDSIEGIPPAIAIEQRNSVKSTRSTVGTMTEICDHMKLLWPHLARLHCRQCGRPVQKETPRQIWDAVASPADSAGAREILITFDVPLAEKLPLAESLNLIAKQGYQRILFENQIVRLEDAHDLKFPGPQPAVTVLQDRLKPLPAARARFVEACEQAYHFGKGKLAIRPLSGEAGAPRLFSNRLHCAPCNLEYREPSPALFSFNHPVGACPTCRGFGRIITIDHDLALPDRSRTLAEGVVRPWQTGQSAECQDDLMKFCKLRKVPTDVPFRDLPQKWQDWLINGDPGYGKDKAHEWPRAWYGVKGYFRWLESRAYKMHVRVLLSRYRSYTPCPACHGQRFQPEALLYRVALEQSGTGFQLVQKGGPDASSSFSSSSSVGFQPVRSGRQAACPTLTLADFYTLPIRDALAFIEHLAANHQAKPNDPLALVLNEVRARLGYLNDVGLGYLTLDRATRSLSGGETERVSLTTCLGTRLVNTLFVLDEPSVGLHPRDTRRLVRILEQLRDAGNTVIVVEHEASVMRAADQIVDLGPGHGATGGQLVFQGAYADILKSPASLTGKYLSGRQQIPIPARRPTTLPLPSETGSPAPAALASETPEPLATAVASPSPRGEGRGEGERGEGVRPTDFPAHGGIGAEFLTLSHANLHNLQDLTVQIPLARLVCVTGVSGSGKTTLIREVLLPLLTAKFEVRRPLPEVSESADDPDSDSDSETISHPPSAINSPSLRGWETLGAAVLVDQSILSKTPRSNPAVYTGAFDEIRELFAQSDLARQRGLNASAFSFNSAQGQCERCRGAGFEKIEMQFLSDVFIRCPECQGRRYRPHILEIKIAGDEPAATPSSPSPHDGGVGKGSGRGAASPRPSQSLLGKRALRAPNSALRTPHSAFKSIADLLDATVDEAVEFLRGFGDARPAVRALAAVTLLQEVGLGYLRLGQPINTLSGGESQRLKLVRHLAEFSRNEDTSAKPTLFLFDEPTTGLHFDDVRVLLKVFQRLVDAGHSVIIIEHNLDVIKAADWVLDLGPDAGDQGGRIVAQGTPEQIAACPESHTGYALREVLPESKPPGKFREPGPQNP
jgi:excinuclease ABC subunit A